MQVLNRMCLEKVRAPHACAHMDACACANYELPFKIVMIFSFKSHLTEFTVLLLLKPFKPLVILSVQKEQATIHLHCFSLIQYLLIQKRIDSLLTLNDKKTL